MAVRCFIDGSILIFAVVNGRMPTAPVLDDCHPTAVRHDRVAADRREDTHYTDIIPILYRYISYHAL